jgi:hypothetical protein
LHTPRGFVLLAVLLVSPRYGFQNFSCKNCHETQSKDPEENDGKPWPIDPLTD